jgi:hypothetical protein
VLGAVPHRQPDDRVRPPGQDRQAIGAARLCRRHSQAIGMTENARITRTA